MDNLSFLESEEQPEVETPEAATPEAPQEQPVEQLEEAKAEPVRDEKGRFAPKQAEEPRPDPVMVPIQALHETRDKVRDLEARLAQISQPQEPAFEPLDPEAYQHLQQQIDQRVFQTTLSISHRFAEQQFGKEAVDAALEWGKQRCAADPHFNAQVYSSPDPVGFAVEQYKREQIASQVDLSEFEKFKAWQAAQAQAQQQAAPAAETPTPPKSLASLPSSGGAGHVPVGPGQAFDTLFNR